MNFYFITLSISIIALLFILAPLLKGGMTSTKVRFALFFAGFFIIGSWGSYHHLGAYQAVKDKLAIDELMESLVVLLESNQTSKVDLLHHLQKMEMQIQENPWGMSRMASLYQQGGFYPQSIALYQKLIEQFPQTSEYGLNWVYCHSLQGNGILPTTVRSFAERLLGQLKDKIMLMNLLAIDDYFQNHFEQAIKGWKYILTFDDDLTNERRVVLENAISQAKKMVQSPTCGFQIHVYLNEQIALTDIVDDVVYIYVRKPSQKRPLLVTKRRVRDLPLTLTLDNTDAMLGEQIQPGMEVEIGAHISKNGVAQLQSGDIRGMMGPILVKSQVDVDLEINHNEPQPLKDKT